LEELPANPLLRQVLAGGKKLRAGSAQVSRQSQRVADGGSASEG